MISFCLFFEIIGEILSQFPLRLFVTHINFVLSELSFCFQHVEVNWMGHPVVITSAEVCFEPILTLNIIFFNVYRFYLFFNH